MTLQNNTRTRGPAKTATTKFYLKPLQHPVVHRPRRGSPHARIPIPLHLLHMPPQFLGLLDQTPIRPQRAHQPIMVQSQSDEKHIRDKIRRACFAVALPPLFDVRLDVLLVDVDAGVVGDVDAGGVVEVGGVDEMQFGVVCVHDGVGEEERGLGEGVHEAVRGDLVGVDLGRCKANLSAFRVACCGGTAEGVPRVPASDRV